MERRQKSKVANSQFFYGFITSFCAPAIVLVSSILLNTHISVFFYLLSYLLPLTIYFFDFFYRSKLEYLFILPVAASIPIMFMSYNKDFIILYYLLIIGCLLYPIFFKEMTKVVPFFKDLFVSLVWSLLILLVCVNYNIPLNIQFVLLSSFVFIRVFVDASYCDIKDYESDRAAGFRTVPAVLGVKNTMIMLQAVNLLSVFGIFYVWIIGLFPLFVLSLIIPVIVNLLFLALLSKKFNYSIYLVDSEFIIWVLSLLTVRSIWKQ